MSLKFDVASDQQFKRRFEEAAKKKKKGGRGGFGARKYRVRPSTSEIGKRFLFAALCSCREGKVVYYSGVPKGKGQRKGREEVEGPEDI